jgi:hypothetical protein
LLALTEQPALNGTQLTILGPVVDQAARWMFLHNPHVGWVIVLSILGSTGREEKSTNDNRQKDS